MTTRGLGKFTDAYDDLTRTPVDTDALARREGASLTYKLMRAVSNAVSRVTTGKPSDFPATNPNETDVRVMNRRAFLTKSVAGAASVVLASHITGIGDGWNDNWEDYDNFWEAPGEDALDRFGGHRAEELIKEFHILDHNNETRNDEFANMLYKAVRTATGQTLAEGESVRMRALTNSGGEGPFRQAAYLQHFYAEVERGIGQLREEFQADNPQRPMNQVQQELDNLRGAPDPEGKTYTVLAELGPKINLLQLKAIRNMLRVRIQVYLKRRNPQVNIDPQDIINLLDDMSQEEITTEGRDDVSLKDFIERIIIPLA
ncbi:MAG TPA: hypothetical protein VIT68_05240 [Candidatus Gracilibacteria bacterium]